jgi:hypothetical protein
MRASVHAPTTQRGGRSVDEVLQQEIIARVRGGQPADEIEADVASVAGSDDEESAAVWLYAWVEHERRERQLGRELILH